jgi:hypothetical protein
MDGKILYIILNIILYIIENIKPCKILVLTIYADFLISFSRKKDGR